MKKELWVRLRQYRFANLVPPTLVERVRSAFGNEDAFTRAFAAKVAKKHGWTEEFAFLAIREYKKFVYLGVVSHYNVTPPTVIDKVWHEHQLFTRGYREFCQTVLHRNFDHMPELFGFEEQSELFSAQYLKTLAFYEHEFGVKPPEEIWGRPKFNQTSIKGVVTQPKKQRTDSAEASSDGSTPLHIIFDSGPDRVYAPIPVTSEIVAPTIKPGGDENNFAGGGATGSFGKAETAAQSNQADGGQVSAGGSNNTSDCSTTTSTSSGCSSSCGGGGGD